MECYSSWQNRNETVGHFARKSKLLSAPVLTSLMPFCAPSRSPLAKFAELGKRWPSGFFQLFGGVSPNAVKR